MAMIKCRIRKNCTRMLRTTNTDSCTRPTRHTLVSMLVAPEHCNAPLTRMRISVRTSHLAVSTQHADLCALHEVRGPETAHELRVPHAMSVPDSA
eukprot:33477-Rhodomonas_salina.1